MPVCGNNTEFLKTLIGNIPNQRLLCRWGLAMVLDGQGQRFFVTVSAVIFLSKGLNLWLYFITRGTYLRTAVWVRSSREHV